MPYRTKKKSNGKVGIYKADTGEEVGESDSESKAKGSIRARYAGEDKKKKKGTKDYDYWDSYENRISPEEANYDPLGGFDIEGEACANCQFFSSPDGCLIVMGDISPTGHSRYWTEKIVWTPDPIHVIIDNKQTDNTNDTFKSKVAGWLTNIFSLSGETPAPVVSAEKSLQPIRLTDEPDGRLRAHIVFSNNFEDRHEQIIPAAVQDQYVEWAYKTGLFPEFQMCHLGSKSKWGQADAVARIGNFTVATGLVNPGFEDFAKAVAADPNTGVSNGYYATLTQDKKEFTGWWPFEVSPLPFDFTSNVWMGDEYKLEAEGYIMKPQYKEFLKGKGVPDTFIDALETDILARGTDLEGQGVGSKEVTETPPANTEQVGTTPEVPAVGALTAESLGQIITTAIQPLADKIGQLETGQKDIEEKIKHTQADLVNQALMGSIGSQVSQGFKASESDSNVIPSDPNDPLNTQMNTNWLAEELKKVGLA